MEILVRFITCCGINMWIYLGIYLRSEMPDGKNERFCSILISSSIVLGNVSKLDTPKIIKSSVPLFPPLYL